MEIDAAPGGRLHNEGNATKPSLYSNDDALSRKGSQTQATSAAKSKLLRKIGKSQKALSAMKMDGACHTGS